MKKLKGEDISSISPTRGFKIETFQMGEFIFFNILSYSSLILNFNIYYGNCWFNIFYFCKSVKLNVWDIGGQSFIRPYWRNYFERTEAIIWVIDSTDPSRFIEGMSELGKVLKTEKLAGASLLVLANKQDIPGAIKCEELIKEMKLSEIIEKRNWHIEATSAITGEGILEGFRWMVRDVCSRIYTFT